MQRRVGLLSFVLAGLAGCGAEVGVVPLDGGLFEDAASSDAPPLDAARRSDAGASDTGVEVTRPDAGPPDAGPPDAGPPDAGPPPLRPMTPDESDPSATDRRVYAVGWFDLGPPRGSDDGEWFAYTDTILDGAAAVWVDGGGNLFDLPISGIERFVHVPGRRDAGWIQARSGVAYCDAIGPESEWRVVLDREDVEPWVVPLDRRVMEDGENPFGSRRKVNLHVGAATHPQIPGFLAVTVALTTVPASVPVGSATIDQFLDVQFLARTFDYGETWTATQMPTSVGGLYYGSVVGTTEVMTCANSSFLSVYGNLSIHGSLFQSPDLGATFFPLSGDAVPRSLLAPGSVAFAHAWSGSHAPAFSDRCDVFVADRYATQCKVDDDARWDDPRTCLSTQAVQRMFQVRAGTGEYLVQTEDGYYLSSDGGITGERRGWDPAWGSRNLADIADYRHGLLVAGRDRGGLVVSTDLAATWSTVNHDISRALCGAGRRHAMGCSPPRIKRLRVAADAAIPPEVLIPFEDDLPAFPPPG